MKHLLTLGTIGGILYLGWIIFTTPPVGHDDVTWSDTRPRLKSGRTSAVGEG